MVGEAGRLGDGEGDGEGEREVGGEREREGVEVGSLALGWVV